jgi:hypothetical protein
MGQSTWKMFFTNCDSGSSKSASGSGDGAFMSGDGKGDGNVFANSSSFFFIVLIRLPKLR